MTVNDMNISINENCNFLYVCPVCFGTCRTSLNLFGLSGGETHLFKCADRYCGSVCAELKKISASKYRISADCPYCGERHSRTVSAKELWTARHASLECPAFGIKLFLFGSDMEAIANELAETVSKAEDIAVEVDRLLSDCDPIMAEMLMIFDRMCCHHAISCVCGSSEIAFRREDENILLACKRCGRHKSFAVTKDNLLRLMNASEVILGV